MGRRVQDTAMRRESEAWPSIYHTSVFHKTRCSLCPAFVLTISSVSLPVLRSENFRRYQRVTFMACGHAPSQFVEEVVDEGHIVFLRALRRAEPTQLRTESRLTPRRKLAERCRG
jgi:hypothetical protein